MIFYHRINIRFDMVKKVECPGCAMEVDSNHDACPVCGYDFPKQSASMKIAVWLFIILMLMWLIF